MVVTQHIVGGRCAGTIFGGFTRSRGRGGSIGNIGARSGGSVWGEREHGDSLGAAVASRGSCRARAMGGDHRSRLPEHRAAVLELVAKQPYLTLQEIRGALVAKHGIAVGLTSVWRFLRAQQITRKKRAYMPPSRIAPT